MKHIGWIMCLLTMIMATTMLFFGCSGKESEVDDSVGEAEDLDEKYEDGGAFDSGDYTIVYLQHGPLVNMIDNASEKMGAMGPGGDLVIPCEYDDIDYIGGERFIVTKYDEESHETCKQGILDTEGKEIVPCEYAGIAQGAWDHDEAIDDIVSAVKKEGDKVGYVSTKDGSTVIEPKYESAGEFIDDRARVEFEEGEWGFIDRDGNTVIEGTYSLAEDFMDGVAEVEKNDKLMVIDRNGKQLLESKDAGDIISYSDGMAVVEGASEDRYSVIDSKGKEIVGIKAGDVAFDDVIIVGSLIVVNHESDDPDSGVSKSGIYDRSGKELFKGKLADVAYAHDRIIVQDRKTKKYGLIDDKGKELIPRKYHNISFFGRDKNVRGSYGELEDSYENDVMFLQPDEDGPCYLADMNGNKLTNKEYQAIGDFSENGLAAVVYDGKVGFIDNTGKEVISCSFSRFVSAREEPDSDAEDYLGYLEGQTAFFPNGYAAVNKEEGGSYAFIDSSGREITDYVYDHPQAFVKESYDYNGCFLSEDLISGRKDSKTVIIDDDGKDTVVDEKDELEIEELQYGNGLIPVKKKNDASGLWALMDEDGNIITEYIYDVWLDNA